MRSLTQKTTYVLLSLVLTSVVYFWASAALAAPNLEINYQGKLTDTTGAAVTDGTYNIDFALYTGATGGTDIWSESVTVTVTNGLFSVLLGDSTSLTNVDFNQTLYLGVNVESDGEMSPRKLLGTVPAAFEAQRLDGLATSSFLRSDADDTASGLLTFTGITNFATSTFVVASTTRLRIAGEEFDDLTGSGLVRSGTALSANISEDNLNIADAPVDGYVLQASSTAAGGFVWQATSSLGFEQREAVTLAGEDYLSLSGQEITANAINPDNLAVTDFGDFTCNGTTCSLDTNSVADNEIDYGAVTVADFTNDAGYLTDISGSSFYDLADTPSSYNENRIFFQSGFEVNDSADFTFNGTTLAVPTLDLTNALAGTEGGTGLSTITEDELLIGGAGNTWSQIATSSLGLGNGTFTGLSDTQGSLTANRLLFTNSGGTALTDAAGLTFDGTTFNAPTTTLSGQLTLSGSAANLALGSNWLSGDGDDEGIFVDSTGQVGIGTTTPSSKLTVAGDFRLTGAFRDATNNAGTDGQILQTTGSGTQWVATSSLGFSENPFGAAINANELASEDFGSFTCNGTTCSLDTNSVADNEIDYSAVTLNDFTFDVGSVSKTEFGYLNGVTSAIQTQLNTKLEDITNENIGDLADVTTTGAASGDLLSYNGSNWVDVATSTLGLGDGTFLGLSDTFGSYTADRIPFTNSAGDALIDSSDFVFDGSNLGIGTSSPNSKLTVAGEINIDDPSSGLSILGTRYFYASSTNDSIAIGENAGTNFNSITTKNVAIGFGSGANASTTLADNNNYIGEFTGQNNTGFGNNFLGISTGQNNTGNYNNFFGDGAGLSNTGSSNAIIGRNAGKTNTGNYNNLFGDSAGFSNTGSTNNFFGSNAGKNNTGSNNNFLGAYAGLHNTGDFNEFMGRETGGLLQATNTVAIGGEALRGVGVLFSASRYQAVNNVALGYRAGYSVETGADNNILLGYQAADNLTTGANNIVLGYDVDLQDSTQSNTLNIGNLIFGTGLDGTGTTLASGNVGIGTTSPSSKLTVAGDLFATGAFRDSSGASGTTGQLLSSTGNGTSYISTSTLAIALSDTTGTLAANRGGTGLSTITQNQLLIGGAGNTWSQVATSSLGLGDGTFLGLSDTFGSYTANRIPFTNSAGDGLTDSAGLTYDGSTLGVSGDITLSNGSDRNIGIAGGGSGENLTLSAGSDSLFGNGGDLNLYAGFSTSATDGNVIITAPTLSSNVGIGTSSPNSKLTVAGNINIDDPSSGLSILGTRYFYASSTNDSIAIGENAGVAFNSGTTNNVAIGTSAGASASSAGADDNNYIGYFAGENNSGDNNNLFGNSAGEVNSGDNNNAFGDSAGFNNGGNNNNFLGYNAGSSNGGSDNNFLGRLAGSNNTGDGNNFLGRFAGYNNSSGDYNELIGFETGLLMEANRTVAIGGEALRGGSGSLFSTPYQADNNVALGYRAGYNATTSANNNILLGYQAADNLTTGANNIVLGYDVDLQDSTQSNTLNIGNLIFGTGLDGTGTTLASGNVGIGTTSPSSKLTVVGTFRTTGTSTLATTSISNLTLAQALGATSGGTGLSSITQNQLLIGGAGNTWSQVATSSLGLGDGTFLGLSDTFGSYTADRIPFTNGAGDGLIDSAGLRYNGSELRVDGNITLTAAGDRTIGIAGGGAGENLTLMAGTAAFGDGGDLNLYAGSGSGDDGNVIITDPSLTSNVGIGTSSPNSKLTVDGDFSLTGAFRDGNNSPGTDGYILQTTGSSTQWVATSTLGFGGGGVSTFLGLSDTPGSYTANRIPFTNSAGNALTDAAGLTYDGVNLGIGGSNGIAFGGTRMFYASSTSNGIAIGENAGSYYDPSVSFANDFNIYIGSQAGENASSSVIGGQRRNIGIGLLAAQNNIGFENIILGSNAGQNNTGDYGVFLGQDAGQNNMADNVFFAGDRAGEFNTADNNNFLGLLAGQNNTGTNNNFLGQSTGRSNTGSSNNFLGAFAGDDNTGDSNVFLGSSAGGDNTGDDNNFIGNLSGQQNTGDNNNFFGVSAGQFNTGNFNEFIGFQTGRFLQSTSTVAIGGEAFFGAGATNYQAVNNVALGYRAGYNADTGANNNILLGYQAADNLTTGANNIVLGYDVDLQDSTQSNTLNIGNLIFGTGIDGTGTTLASGNVGIGTTSPNSKLDVWGDFRVGTGTTPALFADVSTGNIGIGSTTPNSLLSISGTGYSGAGTFGIDQYLTTKNSVASALQVGNTFYLNASNTATTTIVGNLMRIEDDTEFGNTVRALEVQADRGVNTLGENTALSGFARTFGVRGTTRADAGGEFEPAGGFFETQGTTQGNAIRGYSGSITTASLLALFQDTSDFTGTGLLMNFGNTTGNFASTSSKFVDFQNAGTSKFSVTAQGTTTIGDGTTSNQAGLQIGYGGLCVDNDGSCTASTTGRITSVSSATGNSDLAEQYFSGESLFAGEIVFTKGNLSVGRADEATKDQIIGVVSTKPGLTLGFDDTSLNADETGYPIALSGRVPIKLSNENGPIAVGDELTLSSIPGVAMKATEPGPIIGVALESYRGNQAYSETYVNQFGDDLVDPVYEPINQNNDPRINDGCYFGGGNATGEGDCTPLTATTTDAQVEEANYLAAKRAREAALRELGRQAADTMTTAAGEPVSVGQIVMFVDLRHKYFNATTTLALQGLMSSSSTVISLDGEEEIVEVSLMDRMVNLVSRFYEGVLTLVGLQAEKVTTDELCIGGTCVNEAQLIELLQQDPAGDATASSEANQSETSTETESEEPDGNQESTPGEKTTDDSGGGSTTTSTPAVDDEHAASSSTATTSAPVESDDDVASGTSSTSPAEPEGDSTEEKSDTISSSTPETTAEETETAETNEEAGTTESPPETEESEATVKTTEATDSPPANTSAEPTDQASTEAESATDQEPTTSTNESST